MLFDTHAHLDLAAADPDGIPALVAEAAVAGVARILHISTGLEEHHRAWRVGRTLPGLYFAAGLPPDRCLGQNFPLDQFIDIIGQRQIRAIGESGLDYHHAYGTPAAQRALFARQAALAVVHDLPLVVHTRNADADTLAVLRDHPGIRGVIHCFTSGPELAAAVVDLGFYVSFSGILTFPRSEPIRAAAVEVPLDRIVVETDAPFLAPVPHRGQPNHPRYLEHTVRCLAGLRGVSWEVLASITTANACRLFGVGTPEQHTGQTGESIL